MIVVRTICHVSPESEAPSLGDHEYFNQVLHPPHMTFLFYLLCLSIQRQVLQVALLKPVVQSRCRSGMGIKPDALMYPNCSTSAFESGRVMRLIELFARQLQIRVSISEMSRHSKA